MPARWVYYSHETLLRGSVCRITSGDDMSIKDSLKREIDKLPEDLLAVVYDFVQFLEMKLDKNLLAKASQEMSQASFDKIWDNEEDAVYDHL